MERLLYATAAQSRTHQTLKRLGTRGYTTRTSNPYRSQVLSLYRRCMQLSVPYVQSPSVSNFMRREFLRALDAEGIPRDEMLRYEESLNDWQMLLRYCRVFHSECTIISLQL